MNEIFNDLIIIRSNDIPMNIVLDFLCIESESNRTESLFILGKTRVHAKYYRSS